MIGFVWFIFILVCLLLVLVVLLQRGESGGVGAAFGGGGGETAFGVKADMTWKKTTGYLAGGFFVLALLLGQLMTREQGVSVASDDHGADAPLDAGGAGAGGAGAGAGGAGAHDDHGPAEAPEGGGGGG